MVTPPGVYYLFARLASRRARLFSITEAFASTSPRAGGGDTGSGAFPFGFACIIPVFCHVMTSNRCSNAVRK